MAVAMAVELPSCARRLPVSPPGAKGGRVQERPTAGQTTDRMCMIFGPFKSPGPQHRPGT
eukprot:1156599-Pelagomonas_calceolata.AAC.2